MSNAVAKEKSSEAEHDPHDAEAIMALDAKAWAEGWDSHWAKCLELSCQEASKENPNI